MCSVVMNQAGATRPTTKDLYHTYTTRLGLNRKMWSSQPPVVPYNIPSCISGSNRRYFVIDYIAIGDLDLVKKTYTSVIRGDLPVVKFSHCAV